MAIKYPINLTPLVPPPAVGGVERDNQSFVATMVRKADTEMVAAATAFLPEDEFTNLYYTTAKQDNVMLAPPLPPKTLKQFATHNNILLQCVEAMEVNIDGTGHTFVGKDGKDADKKQVTKATSFFAEPFPSITFTSLRRDLRRDLEQTGWGFIEVLRNLEKELVGMRHVPCHTVRFCKTSDPVLVKRTITRDGKDITIEYLDRVRKFAQVVNAVTKRYYREYGTEQQVNNTTGEWGGDEIPADKRGTELMVFRVFPDVDSPYGLPRWVNQIPSVIGSRKGEEQNLSLLDAGGIPPTLIFISGGAASTETSQTLKAYLSGQNTNKQRAAVIDVSPNSGSMDTPSVVDIKVERFGSESVKDAMFSSYDKDCAERVRTGFRLPPLFIGKAADYALATAQTSYMVAEAQVFQPERDKFDAYINATVMKELECTDILFKSNPITLKDATSMLAGLTATKDVADSEGWMNEVNKATGMNLKHDQAKEDLNAAAKAPPPPPPGSPFGAKKPGAKPGAKPPFGKTVKKVKKEDGTEVDEEEDDSALECTDPS